MVYCHCDEHVTVKQTSVCRTRAAGRGRNGHIHESDRCYALLAANPLPTEFFGRKRPIK